MRKEIFRMKRQLLTILLMSVIGITYYACSSSNSCNKDSDCPSGQKCLNQKCYSNATTPDPQIVDPNTGCSKDDECGTCKRCDDGICKPVSDCDAGLVQIDGSRDIVKSDVMEDILDIESDAGDVEDIAGDIEDADTDIEITDVDDGGDTGPADIDDVGGDISDVSDVAFCDVSASLVVTKREPVGDLPRGTSMKISGQGFDNECGTLSVYFNGDNNPAKITEVASSYIKVTVPGFAQSGDITVKSFGQEQKLTGGSGFKLLRRLLFTDFGSGSSPGNKFFALSFPNFNAYMSGKYDSDGNFPYPILLDPYNLMILVISTDSGGSGYSISAYDFATVSFIKKVTNDQAKTGISSAVLDTEKNRIYLTSLDGMLYVHEMGALTLKDSIHIGVALYGIDIDKQHNRIFLSGTYDSSLPPPAGPPQDYRGALFVIDRDTFKPVGNQVVTFGDKSSIAFDAKYHAQSNRVFVVDYIAGYLYVFNADDLNSETAPKQLGSDFGPMRIAFGKGGVNVYIIGNNSPKTPIDTTATIVGFSADTLTEISGSPFDTKLITSTSLDNSKNLVNLVYDDLDGYLIAVSDADNRIAVIIENTFSFLTNPASPDNTRTLSTSGNFGIAVEDW